MVAAHGWDLAGAKRVGMSTGWVSRKEGRLLTTLPAVDVEGRDLLELAHRLVETMRG